MEEKRNFAYSKRIFKIAFPIILYGIAITLQQLVDKAFLGSINSEYFSALGNVLFPFYTTIETIIAISIGTTILIAQKTGAKDFQNARLYAETSFKYNTAFSLLFFIFWFFFPKTIFQMMGVQSPILEYSTRYVRFLSVSLLIFGLEISASAIFMGIGITRPIMIAGIIKNVLNIILDWLLIFGNLGFPRLEIEGAALATTISNLVAGPVLLLLFFLSKKKPFMISIKRIIFNKLRDYKDIIKIGIPAGMETLIWHISNLIIIRFLNSLDYMATGIYTLVFSIDCIAYFIFTGFAKACIALVGQKTGEKDIAGAKKTGRLCLLYIYLINVLIATSYILFTRPILGLFTDNSELILKAVPFMFILALNTFPRSTNIIIGHGIKGYGDTKWMLFGQIVGSIIIVSSAYLFIFVFKLNLLGLFFAVLMDESVRSIINSLRFFKGREFFLRIFRIQAKKEMKEYNE